MTTCTCDVVTDPAAIAAVLPAWALRLLDEGGRETPWVEVPVALAYLPVGRKKAYDMCDVYDRRLSRERRRRGRWLLDVEATFARPNEIPCLREGRRVLVSKRLLLVKLLGYLPIIEDGGQP